MCRGFQNPPPSPAEKVFGAWHIQQVIHYGVLDSFHLVFEGGFLLPSQFQKATGVHKTAARWNEIKKYKESQLLDSHIHPDWKKILLLYTLHNNNTYTVYSWMHTTNRKKKGPCGMASGLFIIVIIGFSSSSCMYVSTRVLVCLFESHCSSMGTAEIYIV